MLLFDEDLSHRLVEILSEEYPGCIYVRDVGLRGTEDFQIWHYCKENRPMIVSKDTDFRERSFLEGSPPKVIWLDVGNAGTTDIADLSKPR
jgi:predicted nuclease of predicted toxin-antitoxin system